MGALNAFIETTDRVLALGQHTALLHASSEASQEPSSPKTSKGECSLRTQRRSPWSGSRPAVAGFDGHISNPPSLQRLVEVLEQP